MKTGIWKLTDNEEYDYTTEMYFSKKENAEKVFNYCKNVLKCTNRKWEIVEIETDETDLINKARWHWDYIKYTTEGNYDPYDIKIDKDYER